MVSRTLQNAGVYKVGSPLLPKNKEVGRPIREVTALRRALRLESPTGFLFTGVAGLRLPIEWRADRDRWEKAQGWYRASSDLYDLYYVMNTHIKESLRASRPHRTIKVITETVILVVCRGSPRCGARWGVGVGGALPIAPSPILRGSRTSKLLAREARVWGTRLRVNGRILPSLYQEGGLLAKN